MIVDGKQGCFVPIHNPQALASAIEKLVGNRKSMKSMSLECIKRVKEYYNIERFSRQFIEICMDVRGENKQESKKLFRN